MNKVRTILEDVDPSLLGHTQCHEHLFLKKGPSYTITPVLLMESLENTIAELLDFRKAGGVSVVDAQPAYCGRIAENLVRAAQDTKVKIIASTGFHKLEYYPSECQIFTKSYDELVNFFVHEIEEGMISSTNDWLTSYRAGIIKVALDSSGPRHSLISQKLLEAAISSALKTGAALLCHTDDGIQPTEYIEFMLHCGLSPHRIILSHLDRTCLHNELLIKESLSKGIYITLDTIHRYKYRDDKSERQLIMELSQAGYARQMLLSLDTTNQRLRHYGGEIGLDYLLRSFLQLLKDDGVAESDLFYMTVGNASHVLPLQPK
ncbi:MAG: hypothetical protein Q4C95_08685 [Planctomycetia bacterium]|nr:hypothetical protein [Planctomycetia bacterium]